MNAAVIGLGAMGKVHIQALQQLGITVSAVCDLRPEALQDFSPVMRTYQQWQELIDKESANLDLVSVTTNGPSHAEIVMSAARAGINHILCEKPMATSGKLTRDMVRVCDDEGRALAVNLNRRFVGEYIRLRELVQSGVIGDVRHISVIAGAGGLGCIGTHFFDFIEWLTGAKAVWVVGELESHPLPNVRGEQFFDPGGRGMIRYDTGMNVAVEFSEDIPVLSRIHIRGTQGHIDISGQSGPDAGHIDIWTRPENQRHEPKTRSVNPIHVDFEVAGPIDVIGSTRLCIQDLLNGRSERTDLAGISSVDTVLAFHLSGMRALKKVTLPLEGEDLLFDIPMT